MRFTGKALAVFITFLLLTLACLDDNANQNSALVNVYLTDGPGDFDDVYLDIRQAEVFVHTENSAGTRNWIPLYYLPLSNVINVSSLVNNTQLILGRSEVPLGRISQLKLVFGDGQYLVLDDERRNLSWADEAQKEFVLDVNYPLNGATSYDLVLDIDLARSILPDPNREGDFLFSPIIRSFETGNVAAISGTVTPTDAQPFVHAVLGEDTISTLTDGTGAFYLNGLQAGLYTIYIEPRPPYLDSLTSVLTKIDSVADMETIVLPSASEDE